MKVIHQLLLILAMPALAASAASNIRGISEDATNEDEPRELGGCNYQCPSHGYRIPNRKCYNNIDDCACFSGYIKSGSYCVPKKFGRGNTCDYVCPQYSTQKPNRRCYNNFDDCECIRGYYKKGEQCYKDDDRCDYKCPAYADYKSDRFCYKSFDDCYCLDGYYKSGDKCVKKASNYITLMVTNISFQQPFGGFFVATHNQYAPPLFVLGEESSPELAILAENGDPGPLVEAYKSYSGVGTAFAFNEGAPYFGGDMLEIEIPDDPEYPYVTVATMAINTNDCFVAINGVPLKSGDVFTGVGYDSGSEENNENCNSIPGPACADTDPGNRRDGNGEGFVHVHRGFFGVGNDGLSAVGYDWRNPMVRWEVL